MDTASIFTVCPNCYQKSLVTLSLQRAASATCQYCHHVILEYEPVQGFIYVLSNDHMPDLVKVGLSHRPVQERVDELNAATGVPSPFHIEAYFPSADPEGHEREIHRCLSDARVPGKEFFRCDIPHVISTIERVCGNTPIFLAGQWEGVPAQSAAHAPAHTPQPFLSSPSRQSYSYVCPLCHGVFKSPDPVRFAGNCPSCWKWIETERTSIQ